MGKAVPKNVKSKVGILLKERPELFCTDFVKNKSLLNELSLPLSKVVRNLVAGFITRELLKKAKKERREKSFSERQAPKIAA